MQGIVLYRKSPLRALGRVLLDDKNCEGAEFSIQRGETAPLMKTSLRSGALMCAFLFASIISTFAQGSLTPPGSPAPTMKSLDQIEPRIPVDATHTPGDSADLYVISAPGAYYLTGDVNGVSGKNGILIQATNVTLDLNGFALIGVGGSLAAITDGGVNHGNATIRGGSIVGWGGNGIDLSHSFGSLVADLIVTSNGGVGVTLGDTCVLRDCMIRVNSGDGADAGHNATVTHCSSVGSGNGSGFSLGSDSTLTASTANFNKSLGIFAATGSNLSYCSANENATGGINTGSGVVLTSCTAYNNTGVGIQCGDGAALASCAAYKNATYGIICGNGCQLTGCGAYQNQGGSTVDAIYAGYGCTLTDCVASGNTVQYGILVNPYSTLIHCTASQNTSNQSISAGIIADGCTVNACNCSNNTTTSATVTATTGMGIYCNGTDSIIEHCTCIFNSGDGINVVGRCIVRANLANGNAGSGIHTTGTDSRVEGNEVAGNTANGIQIDSMINLVIGNTARGNTAANYNIATGNRVAAILTPAVTGSAINGDTGGTNFSTNTSSNLVH